VSVAGTESPDWVGVFKDRGCWDLTPELVDAWVAANAGFFRTLSELVPPGSEVLELGCGPGRHALGMASLGYSVTGVDLDPAVLTQARANATAVGAERTRFVAGDMDRLDLLAPAGRFRAITHGGVVEHLRSADRIRATLTAQLDAAGLVVFDVPTRTEKNLRLFERDDIFRQLWTADEWLGDVLGGFTILRSIVEERPAETMTDDLVVALAPAEGGAQEIGR
jgi:protein-L-isoaspartate O-methyltransferase